jgi:hypothetical protein
LPAGCCSIPSDIAEPLAQNSERRENYRRRAGPEGDNPELSDVKAKPSSELPDYSDIKNC